MWVAGISFGMSALSTGFLLMCLESKKMIKAIRSIFSSFLHLALEEPFSEELDPSP